MVKFSAMQLDKALSQISEIHAQVLKTEVFRGYRAATMLVTSGVAFAAAWVQASVQKPSTPFEFAVFWVGVALVSALICAVDIYWSTLRTSNRQQRWRTVHVVAQSVPALLVGAIVTGVSTVLHDDPRLTVRPPGDPTRPPLRIILDSYLRTPPTARILADVQADEAAGTGDVDLHAAHPTTRAATRSATPGKSLLSQTIALPPAVRMTSQRLGISTNP